MTDEELEKMARVLARRWLEHLDQATQGAAPTTADTARLRDIAVMLKALRKAAPTQKFRPPLRWHEQADASKVEADDDDHDDHDADDGDGDGER